MEVRAPATARPRAAAAARAGLGALLVTRPDLAARVLGAQRRDSHPVLRVLGLRHLLEAAALATRPTAGVVAVGLVVDGTHVLSCLGFAFISRSHRRPALRDAAAASTVLVATWLSRPKPTQTGHPIAVAALPSVDPPPGARLVFVVGGRAPAGSPSGQGYRGVLPAPARSRDDHRKQPGRRHHPRGRRDLLTAPCRGRGCGRLTPGCATWDRKTAPRSTASPC